MRPIDGIVPGVERIAVLRANGLGDFVMALPALAAIRAAYPSAELVLLGTEWHAEFLRGRPAPVDRVEVVPVDGGVRQAEGAEPDHGEVERFFERMRRERFDLAFQLYGGGRDANPFLRRLGARVTVGLRSPEALPLDRWTPYVYYQPEILRFLEVVSLAGARPVTLEPHVELTEEDLAEADKALPGSDHALAVLHPGATDARRRWPTDRFAAVGDGLARGGATVIVTGNERERGLAEQLVATMREAATSLAGRLSVRGLAGVLARATVVVANDTGPRHLAEAVGTATVGIYWCGNVINAGPVTRARHRPAISWSLACPACGLDCTSDEFRAATYCDHEVSFVADVPAEEVARSALELLETGSRGASLERAHDRATTGAAARRRIVPSPKEALGAA